MIVLGNMSLPPCCLTGELREQWELNKAIEQELKAQKKANKNEHKLLLLGIGEAGKSTFIKQMKIIHGGGYSEEDKKEHKQQIYGNVYVAIHNLTNAMKKLKLSFDSEENEGIAQSLLGIPPSTPITQELKMQIERVWHDSGIKKCYQRRNEFQLSDSAAYYLDSLDRLCAENYIPSVDDVLRVRVPTTGIIEYTFPLSRDLHFRMVDVGGQRSERRKWIHCFDKVQAIIFLVAVSEYDQVLAEDETQNRLSESVALFGNIISLEFFYNTAIIVFLNKHDLFLKKIEHSNLRDHFPEYTGPDKDPDRALDFIKDLFFRQNNNPKRSMFSHRTCATDTDNIKKVFQDVKTAILDLHLNQFNLM